MNLFRVEEGITLPITDEFNYYTRFH